MQHTLGWRIAQKRREKAVREGRDITQSDLAEAIQASPTSVSEWEADKKKPREHALRRLAAFLDTTEAYLMYGVGGSDQPFVLPQNATNVRSFPDPDATPAAEPDVPPRRGKAGGDR